MTEVKINSVQKEEEEGKKERNGDLSVCLFQ